MPKKSPAAVRAAAHLDAIGGRNPSAPKLGAEIWCRNENKIVARVEVPSRLDAVSIRSGFLDSDPARLPPLSMIVDGALLTCRRCSSTLYFRAKDALPVEAHVGLYNLEP